MYVLAVVKGDNFNIEASFCCSFTGTIGKRKKKEGVHVLGTWKVSSCNWVKKLTPDYPVETYQAEDHL